MKKLQKIAPIETYYISYNAHAYISYNTQNFFKRHKYKRMITNLRNLQNV